MALLLRSPQATMARRPQARWHAHVAVPFAQAIMSPSRSSEHLRDECVVEPKQ